MTVVDDPPVVAMVGGRPITIARLDRRMADVRRGPRGRHLPPDGGQDRGVRRWVVQELVTEAILVHEAEAAGIIAASAGQTRGHDGG